MKKIVLALCVLLAGCGGGGGSTEVAGVVHAANNVLLQYEGGEALTYQFTQAGAYQDGSGAVNITGTETVAIYGPFIFQNQPKETLRRITTLDYPGGSTSATDYYHYDDDGNLVHYLTGGQNYYVNQADHVAGAIVLPAVFSEGDSWENEQIFYSYKGVDYVGGRTFTVVDRQTVAVPYGNVEAYRVNYSGFFTETAGGPIPRTLTVSGTVWVNPGIGIVKTADTTVETVFGYPYTNTFTDELSAINW